MIPPRELTEPTVASPKQPCSCARVQLWWLWLVVALALITTGVMEGHYVVVKRWALTLCTSCIGLGR